MHITFMRLLGFSPYVIGECSPVEDLPIVDTEKRTTKLGET
jgi:hypothetical protein